MTNTLRLREERACGARLHFALVKFLAKAVIEGLGGKAGRPEVEAITVLDLGGYVSRRVKEMTNGNQKPMIGMPKTVEDFPISLRLH